jgi:hypothetical protein
MKKGIPNANGHDNDHVVDVDVEIVAPLTRNKMIQQQSRSSSFGESLGQILFYDDPTGDDDYNDYDDDQDDNRRRRRLSPCRRDMRELAVAILIFGLGWYGPQCILLPYVFAEFLDHQNIPPFQTTKAGDVLVDLMLNQPLVEPPTIPGMYNIYCAVVVIMGSAFPSLNYVGFFILFCRCRTRSHSRFRVGAAVLGDGRGIDKESSSNGERRPPTTATPSLLRHRGFSRHDWRHGRFDPTFEINDTTETTQLLRLVWLCGHDTTMYGRRTTHPGGSIQFSIWSQQSIGGGGHFLFVVFCCQNLGRLVIIITITTTRWPVVNAHPALRRGDHCHDWSRLDGYRRYIPLG